MLKSWPSGCRSERSYVSRPSKGNGTVVAAYFCDRRSHFSEMTTCACPASLRRANAASFCLRMLIHHASSDTCNGDHCGANEVDILMFRDMRRVSLM